jgi:hypothetical protein
VREGVRKEEMTTKYKIKERSKIQTEKGRKYERKSNGNGGRGKRKKEKK